MAAVSRRFESESLVSPAPVLQPAAAVGEISSPARALQARIAEAYVAAPVASPLQVAVMALTVALSTWFGGVALYATL